MKKILILLFSVFSIAFAFSQATIDANGALRPTGAFPVALTSEIKGASKNVADTTARNNIATNLREIGMRVYVSNLQKDYQLQGGTGNGNWVDVTISPTDYVQKNSILSKKPTSVSGLRNFVNKISNGGSTNIMFFGDSRTEYQYVSQSLRNHLTTIYEDGGIGLFSFAYVDAPYSGISIVKSGTSTTKIDMGGEALKSAIGYALQTQTGSIITINTAPVGNKGRFSKAKFYYARQAYATTYNVSIDGTAQTNFVTNIGTGVDSVVYNTTDNTHTLVITHASGSNGYLLECELTRNNNGVVVSSLGHSGLSAAVLATLSPASYLNTVPDLLVIRAGVNGMSLGGESTAAQDIWNIARDFKNRGTKSFLVLGETDNGLSVRAYVDAYNIAYQNMCDTADFAFLNLKNVVRKWSDFNIDGYGDVTVHENLVGGKIIGNYLSDFLFDNTYNANGGASSSSSSAWSTLGNATSSTDFIGTTNSQPLIFKTSGAERAQFTAAGRLRLGASGAPAFALDIMGTTTPEQKIGINGIQALFFPNQSTFLGSVFVGNGGNSLVNTAGVEGQHNVGVGLATLSSTTKGSKNVGIGTFGLFNNTLGEDNTAVGYNTLRENITGSSNVGIGAYSLNLNTTGNNNMAIGTSALFNNTTGINNTAIGTSSSVFNKSGNNNTSLGYLSLYTSEYSSNNTALGYQTLYDLGVSQAATTLIAGKSYIIKSIGTTDFTAIGASSNTIGISFTATGSTTGTGLASPSGLVNNTVIGANSGAGIVYGSNNTIIGANVTALPSNLNNNIIIADGSGKRRINADSLGNVGINTISPQYRLDIDAISGASGNPIRLQGLQQGSITDSLFVTNAGVGKRIAKNQFIQNGTTTFTSIATGANGTAVSVTFSPAFASTPNITLAPNAQVFCWVTTKSASGFSCNCRNDSGGALTPAVDWIATQ